MANFDDDLSPTTTTTTTTMTTSKKRQSIDNSMIRFPKLDECHHFHYPDTAELDNFHVSLINNESYTNRLSNHHQQHNGNGHHDVDDRLLMTDIQNFHLFVRVQCAQRNWTVRRDLRDFCFLDKQLHKCVFDRQHSKLKKLDLDLFSSLDTLESMYFIDGYLERLSNIVDSSLTCGPILHWFEMDNHGNRLINEESDINTPAIGAAFVIKKHCKQDVETEISLEIGELISVIEMPPLNESFYWKGKKGFEVGFFPAECVQLIDDKISRKSEELLLQPLKKCVSPTVCHRPFDLNTSFSDSEYDHTDNSPEAAIRKRNKISVLFSNFLAGLRMRRRDQLKRSGILKERVFGCDLCEHLENSGHEYPLVLTACCSYIEAHGLKMNGIYRISGVVSTINRLRTIFDEDRIPNELMENNPLSSTEPLDIHAVGSLLKLYFRELPNPLLTYSLFDSFISAMRDESLKDDERVQSIRKLVRRLPPPHWRTLRFLIKHLNLVSQFHEHTGMTTKNIAIVWAPNLLRTKTLDLGKDALQIVATQAVLTEFLITNYNKIFDREDYELQPSRSLYSSFVHSQNNKSPPLNSKCLKYIDVGPEIVPGKFHTIISCRPSQQHSKRSKFNFKLHNIFTGARNHHHHSSGNLETNTANGGHRHHHRPSFRKLHNNHPNVGSIIQKKDGQFENSVLINRSQSSSSSSSSTTKVKYTSSFQASKILCCSHNSDNSDKQVKRSQSFDSYFKKMKTGEHFRQRQQQTQQQQQQQNQDDNNNNNNNDQIVDDHEEDSRRKHETLYDYRREESNGNNPTAHRPSSIISNHQHHIITNETIYEDEENKENNNCNDISQANQISQYVNRRDFPSIDDQQEISINDSVVVEMASDNEDVHADSCKIRNDIQNNKILASPTKSPLPPTSIFDLFLTPVTLSSPSEPKSLSDNINESTNAKQPFSYLSQLYSDCSVQDQVKNEKNEPMKNDPNEYNLDRKTIDIIQEERKKRFQQYEIELKREREMQRNDELLKPSYVVKQRRSYSQRSSMDLSSSSNGTTINSTNTDNMVATGKNRAKLGRSMPTMEFSFEVNTIEDNNKINLTINTDEPITKITITPLRTVNKRQKIIYDKSELSHFLKEDQI